jgi:hypothetical protein
MAGRELIDRTDYDDQLLKVLEINLLKDGLANVWLDVVNTKISSVKKSDQDINFLTVCKNLKGDYSVGLNVGRLYLIGQRDQAIEWLNEQGENGNLDAFVMLGHAYQKGMIAAVKNETLAFNYFLKAADLGNTRAKLYVADMLFSEDSKKANLYLAAAAEEGSLAAAFKLQNSPSIHDPFKRYFWSLVFAFLIEQDRKIGFKARSLVEGPHYYEYEGLPNVVNNEIDILIGNKKLGSSISNYDIEKSDSVRKRLESEVSLVHRMTAQDLLQRWVAEKYVGNKSEEKKLPTSSNKFKEFI